jgi:hypothetical protein
VAAGTAVAIGSGVATSLRTVVTMPVTVAREVVDDVVSTVRRPDGALYLGGLVGLAALGVLEWPEPRPSVWGSRRQRGPAQSRRPAGSTARRGLIGAVPAGHESEPG